MNRKRDLIQIEEAYEAVVGTPPGTKAAKQATKAPKAINRTYERAGKKVPTKGKNTDVPAEKPDGYKGFVQKNSGPEGAGNWSATQLDPDNPKIKLDNEYDVKQLSDPSVPGEEGASDYFKAENEKINRESINTNMAKTNKSIFDRLYEEVMDDETMDAVELGVDVDGGEDVDIEDSESITISIPKDVAKHLHDALMDVMDAADDIEDVEDDLGGEEDEYSEDEYEEDESEKEKKFGGNKGDHPRRFNKMTGHKSEVKDYGEDENEMHEDEEDSFNYFREEIEAEVLGHPLVNQKEGNPTPVTGSSNVVSSDYTSSVDSNGGEALIDYDGYSEEDEGHPLVNQKSGKPTPPKGTANVIKSVIKGGGKGDQEFFQKNKRA